MDKILVKQCERCIAQNTKNAMDLNIVLLINNKFNKRWCSGSAYVCGELMLHRTSKGASVVRFGRRIKASK